MKKILTLALATIFLASCKDDGGNGGSTGYPTDNLTLREQRNAMLFLSYNTNSPATVAYDIFRKVLESEYKEDLTQMSLVYDPSLPLYSEAADSLAEAVSLGLAPEFQFQGSGYAPSMMLVDDIDNFLLKKPIASVSHAVTKNDTAWIVDNKVKFWKDTSGNGFKIETYFLANVPAARYTSLGLDFRMGNVQNTISQGDSVSTWLRDIQNADSTEFVVKAGDEFIHEYILLDSYTDNRIFGDPIAEYTPFGFMFSRNDVVGTRSTPIRHYFLRPGADDDNSDDIEYKFTPVFLSVVWSYNASTGKYDYINSYMSQSSL